MALTSAEIVNRKAETIWQAQYECIWGSGETCPQKLNIWELLYGKLSDMIISFIQFLVTFLNAFYLFTGYLLLLSTSRYWYATLASGV